jgi:hypothetical protein
MSELRAIDQNEPWYRNPWVWLLIAIPSLTVAGCMLTIYLAITNPHILVGEVNTQSTVTAGSTDTGRE